jgi:hypothetical protein
VRRSAAPTRTSLQDSGGHCQNHTRRILRPELDAAKVEWHGLHGFRRGLATILHSFDVSELTIKHILRHSTKDVTSKSYIKSNDATSRKALELVEKEFLKTQTQIETLTSDIFLAVDVAVVVVVAAVVQDALVGARDAGVDNYTCARRIIFSTSSLVLTTSI